MENFTTGKGETNFLLKRRQYDQMEMLPSPDRPDMVNLYTYKTQNPEAVM